VGHAGNDPVAEIGEDRLEWFRLFGGARGQDATKVARVNIRNDPS
jgi:hypothetical protein